MNGFDVKQVFMDRIYEIIFVLCSLHLGAILVSYVLKWIHPYLKSYSVMHNSHEKDDADNKCLKVDKLQSLFSNRYTKKENKVTHKNCIGSNSTITEEEYISIINYLETCVDVSSIPQEILKKNYSKRNVLNELSLEIDNAISIRKLIRDKLKKRKSSSEAQTNITISPTLKANCSSPKLIFSSHSKSCDVPLHISESSDSFESVCSNNSECKGSSFMPIKHCLEIHDKVRNQEKSRKIHKTKTVEHDTFFDLNSLTNNNKVLKTHVESLRVENHNEYDKQISKENEILEMAINDFENELKPIKDQIKVLKECLNNFDCCETDNSDLSSSVSGPLTQSESYSEEMSTTCNSDLKSFSSKRCKLLGKNFSPLKAEIGRQRNRCKPTLDKNTPLLSHFNSKNSTSKGYKMFQSVDKYTSKCPKEFCIVEVRQSENDTSNLNKRSPIADMYIKLSHCSSQTANFVKTNSYGQNSPDKSVTINLNFSLRAVTLSSTSINNWIKEREMLPVLSEPEDIIGQISHIDTSS